MSSTTDLDRLLAAWLRDGATAAPDAALERALAETEGVRQRRRSGMGVFGGVAWPDLSLHPAALALVLALVVVTTAIGIGTGIIPGPRPDRGAEEPRTQTIEPSGELESFTGADGSFRLLLPSAWDDDLGPSATTTYLQRDATRRNVVRLSIQVADEEGRMRTCDRPAGPWERCEVVEATTLDELAAGIGLVQTGDATSGPQRRVSMMDGEPVRLEHMFESGHGGIGRQYVTYVATMHQGRPYLLRFWTDGHSRLEDVVGEVLNGFSFVDQPPAELQEFTNAEDGYELLLPAAWASTPAEVEFRDGQAATTFGQGRGAGTSARPALTIIVGNPDGSITPCLICHRVVITSLDELEEAVESTPSFLTGGPPERHEDISLGEQPGRSESAGIGTNCLGCPGAYYHVYALRDGRPYVLAFDYWTVRFESLALPDGAEEIFPPSMLEAILESFVFLDDRAPEDGGTTFLAPDRSFQIRMGANWRETDGPDPSALYLKHGSTEMSLRGADAEGRVRTCDTPAGRALAETCATSTATSIGRLAADIGVPALGVAPRGPSRSTISVDGEAARVIDYSGYEHPAGNLQSLRYVVMVHDGRAFVIRMWTSSDYGLPDVDGLLAGFEFLGEERSSTTPPGPNPAPTEEASVDGATFAAPDGTFEIALPTGWELGTGPEPGTLYLTSRYPSLRLSIRAADAEGQIRMCDSPAGPWESCPAVRPSTLKELADAIGLEGTNPDVWIGPIPYDSELDTELAVTSYLTGGVAPPTSVKYVVAMHGGRPFVIRAVQRRSPDNIGDLADLLRGFRFVDAPAPSRDEDGAYVYPEAGFRYLPSGRLWRRQSPDPSYLALTGYGLHVYITSGDAEGRLRRCNEPWRSEDCTLLTVRDLDSLTAALEESGGRPTVRTVDGEPATVVVSGDAAIMRSLVQVAIIHDGRPFLIRITGRADPDDIDRLLAGFEFLDGDAESAGR